MLNRPTESLFYLRILLKTAEKAGVDKGCLMEAADIPPDLLNNRERRMSISMVLRLLKEAIRLSGEPALGVLAGNEIKSIPPSLLNLLAGTSHNMREVTMVASGLYGLRSNMVAPNLEVSGPEEYVILSFGDPSLVHNLSLCELISSMWVRTIKLGFQKDVTFDAVHFAAPRPANISVQEDYFQAPLLFGQLRNQLVCSNDMMNFVPTKFNSGLLKMKILPKAADNESVRNRSGPGLLMDKGGMLDRPTESIFYVQVLLNAAEKAGADRSALMEAAGIPPASLADPEGLTSMSVLLRLIEEGIRMTGEPALCVLAAAGIEKLPTRLYQLLLSSTPTLRMATQLARRYYRLNSAVVEISLEDTGEGTCMILTYRDPSLLFNLSMAEFFLGMWVRANHIGTRQNSPPKAIHFAAPRPADISVHEQFFRAPLLFGQPRNEIVLEPEYMNLPFQFHNPELLDELIKAADNEMANIPPEDDLVGQVGYFLAQGLPLGQGSMRETAVKMGLGERTLNRRLKEQGETFMELLDTTRRELALGYLRNHQVSISEIALLLGYSEIKSFYRAFERWTGSTPAKMRQTQLETGDTTVPGPG